MRERSTIRCEPLPLIACMALWLAYLPIALAPMASSTAAESAVQASASSASCTCACHPAADGDAPAFGCRRFFVPLPLDSLTTRRRSAPLPHAGVE